MAAPVPAVERAARILEVMADSPTRQFGAAQLASELGIHRATCFSILSCLAALDLVRRDPVRKTYSLGPQLLRLGAACADQHPGFSVARREMLNLADRLEVGALLCARVGWDMILLDRVADDPAAFAVPPPDVVTAPIRPPLGAIFVAWSTPEEIAEWLALSPPDASRADVESFRRSVGAVRARGYSIGSETEVEVQLEQILVRLEKSPQRDRLAIALELADLVRTGTGPSSRGRRSAGSQAIDHLVGPIFGPAGAVAYTITIFGRPGQIQNANLRAFAEPLVETCTSITKSVGGVWPSRAGGRAGRG